jgi:hypothetical protein
VSGKIQANRGQKVLELSVKGRYVSVFHSDCRLILCDMLSLSSFLFLLTESSSLLRRENP